MGIEEKRAELRRLQKVSQLKQLRSTEAAPEKLSEKEAKPDVPITGREVARQVGEGALFGFADEISAGGVALMSKLMGDEESEGKSFSDIYNHVMEAEQKGRKRFEEANPKTALGLNVAGGLLTGGVSAAKAIPKNASKLTKALAGAGVVGTDGAIAGAGSAEQGKRAEGAGQGAASALAFTGALKGLTKTARGAVNQRIETDLGKGDDFIPIPMAEGDGKLPWLYRDVLSQTTGGRNIREQSAKVLKKTVARKEEAVTNLKKGKTAATEKINEQTRQAVRAEDKAGSVLRKTLRQQGAEQQQQLKQGSDVATDQARAEMRSQNAVASAPITSTPAEKQALAEASSIDANNMLNDMWQRNGFDSVKGRDFTVNTDDLVNDAIADLDDVAMREFKPEIQRNINAALGKDLRPHMTEPDVAYRSDPSSGAGIKNPQVPTNTGDISGESLMQIRNNLRMSASKMSEQGKSSLEAGAYRKAAHAIDQQIRVQMGDTAKLFDDELEAWGTRQTYKGAVNSAAAKKQGDFDEGDWLSSANRYSKDRSGRGQAPRQQEAYAVQDSIAANKAQTADAVDMTKETSRDSIEAARAKTTETKQDLKANKPDVGAEVQLLEKDLKIQKDQVEEINKRLPQQKPNFLRQKATGAVVGAPMAMFGIPGALAAPFVGSQVSKGLGTETGQRLVAGQTGPQKYLAESLRKMDKSGASTLLEDALRGLNRGFIVN